MTVFDARRDEQSWQAFTLKYVLNESREHYERNQAVGNSARQLMNEMTYGWLVGLQQDVVPALHKYRSWFEYSRDIDEQFGDFPLSVSAFRDWAYGLCLWMLDGRNHPEVYRGACDLMDRAYATAYRYGPSPSPPKSPPKIVGGQECQESKFVGGKVQDDRVKLPARDCDILESMRFYFTLCLQSGELERGLALYCRVGGNTAIDAKSIRDERDLGCWISDARLRGVSEDEIVAVGTGFLTKVLQEDWLGSGQAAEAATWLKIVFWHSGRTKTPLETVLKAYDCMPKVQRPDFL